MDVLAHRTNGAIFEEHDAVGNVADSRIVRDDDDGAAVLVCDAGEQPRDVGTACGVERGRRLVGEDQIGIADHRARNRDALLLAAAELVRVRVRPMCQTEHGKRSAACFFDRGAFRATELQGHGHVFPGPERRQQIVVLENETDLIPSKDAQVVLRGALDRAVADVDTPGGRLADAAQDLQQRAFAASRRAHEEEDLAATHVERDAAHGMDGGISGAIDHGNVFQPRRHSRRRRLRWHPAGLI